MIGSCSWGPVSRGVHGMWRILAGVCSERIAEGVMPPSMTGYCSMPIGCPGCVSPDCLDLVAVGQVWCRLLTSQQGVAPCPVGTRQRRQMS
jgi:hypothetical protein